MNKAFIRQRNEEINKAAAIRHQMDMDALAIILHDPEIMGKNTMGPDRIIRVMKAVHNLSMELSNLCGNDPERDYLVYKLDRKLEESLKDKLQPFEVRYEGLLKPVRPIGK